MPKSKHRRKTGGKSIKHPGRVRQLRERAERSAESQFNERYRYALHRQFPNETAAGFMVDLLSDTVQFIGAAAEFWPVAKAELFRQFMEPVDAPDTDDEIEPYTFETAETALAFLVEHGMAEVSGDEVSIPDRFLKNIVDSGDEVAPGTSAEV
jgi:hypothetical protein